MNDLTLLTQENMLPIAGSNVNLPAVKKVTDNLPALTAQGPVHPVSVRAMTNP